jgi:hypothetical protein
VRVIWIYLRIFSLLMLAISASFASDTVDQKIPESRVMIFKSAEDALRFHAISKDEFYLEAGSYKSEESSMKRQFHLSREIHYPVIVEIRDNHYRVLVGPLSTAFAIKQLKNAVFHSAHNTHAVPITANPPIRHQSGIRIVINSEAKAMHFTSPDQGIFYMQAGAFASDKNSRDYQRALLKKVDSPVIIEDRGKLHVVLVGPLHSASEVRALSVKIFGSSSVG